MQREKGLNPRRYLALLQTRLREAEANAARVQALIAWQEALIATMRAQGRDVAFPCEILATLLESLDWSQTLASQARRDLDFVNRNLH